MNEKKAKNIRRICKMMQADFRDAQYETNNNGSRVLKEMCGRERYHYLKENKK